MPVLSGVRWRSVFATLVLGCLESVSQTRVFLTMGNMLIQETRLIGDALRSITALLPDSWNLDVDSQAPRQADAVINLTGPHGEGVSFLVEAKTSGTPTGRLLASLREQASATELPLLYVSDYIGPSLREALASEAISFADATGWVRVTSGAPLILLTGQGAAKSPRARDSSTVVRLNGTAASRIIRALCVTRLPLGVRDLATIADVSPGSVSKLLPTLAAEGIIDRGERGAVVAVRRRALIQRWARDYSFAKSNDSVGYFIAPRGLDRTLSRLADLGARVTLTGSAAARNLLPEGATSVVPLRLLALYTDAPRVLVDELGLIAADPATANTLVAIPQDSEVLTSNTAPTALVLADLLTLPGRGDAEAEQLMDALARADQAWQA